MKKYLNIISFLSLIILLGSCKNILEEKPASFVDPSSFYKSEGQCIAALNGCYTPLTGIYSQGLILATECATDLIYYANTANKDTKFDLSPSTPGIGKALWTNCYKGVMYCNSTIAGIRTATIPEDRKPALIGEAVTLRALYYYVLTSTFGDVPFYLDDVANLATLEQVNALGRMSAVATRDSLIKNLNEYAPALPQQRTFDVPGNRVSAPLAYVLIAKMAMWNKDWQTALTALNKITPIYGSLSDYPLTDTYFRNKNTPESIFEVQFTWSSNGLKKTSAVAAYMTPSRASGTSTYGGINIPELGTPTNPYTSVTATNYFISLYDVFDPRRNIILGYSYNGTPFPRTTQNNGTGKPWIGPKLWCPGMDNASDGNNQKVFRYADVLLMIAECANEIPGNDDQAMAAINEVKQRAQDEAASAGNHITLTLATYPGHDEFFEEVKKERARELAGEYGRRWDLVRWGIFYDAVRSTSAQEFNDILVNLRPYHEYYPIADSEILRSDGKLNNDAYTGY